LNTRMTIIRAVTTTEPQSRVGRDDTCVYDAGGVGARRMLRSMRRPQFRVRVRVAVGTTGQANRAEPGAGDPCQPSLLLQI